MRNSDNILLLLAASFITSCAVLGNSTTPVTQYLNSAQSNLANHNANSALESAIQAIKLDPNNPQAYYLAAQAYQQLNDSPNTNLNYQNALKINNKSESMLISYANFLCAEQNYPQAQSLYNSALNNAQQAHTPATNIYIAYADCQISQNQLDAAANNYTEALHDESAPLSAYLGISYTYILQKNYATAYYYLSLYQGSDDIQSLQMKITTLKELLASSIMLPDRSKLQTALTQNQQALLLLQSAAPKKSVESQTALLAMKDDELQLTPDKNEQPSIEIKPTTVTATVSPAITTQTVIVVKDKNQPAANQKLATEYPQLQTTVAANGRHYIIVKPGDTLYNIALRSKISKTKLIKLNKIKENDVKLGLKLYLD